MGKDRLFEKLTPAALKALYAQEGVVYKTNGLYEDRRLGPIKVLTGTENIPNSIPSTGTIKFS